MGKKVRVWVCWRFHWLTVGTDKWGPPSFTIWPTVTLFLIKCSILKGHVSTCLDPSKLNQDGESHIESSPVPGWGLLSPGSGKSRYLAMGQTPASLAPISHAPIPLLSALGGIYFQASVLQRVLVVYSTISNSFYTTTDCLHYQWEQCGNQSGVKSLEAVWKTHPVLGQGFSPALHSKHMYENSLWSSPRKRNKALAKTLISPLMNPEQHPSLPQRAFQGACSAVWQRKHLKTRF